MYLIGTQKWVTEVLNWLIINYRYVFLHNSLIIFTTIFPPLLQDLYTVDILIMHNAGPLLFLCIMTFYSRWNVSQSVTTSDLCQKMSHFENQSMVRWNLGSTVYLHWVSLNNTACAHLHIPVSSGSWKLMPLLATKVAKMYLKSHNFGLGSACDSPEMEASCEFIRQLPQKSVKKFD